MGLKIGQKRSPDARRKPLRKMSDRAIKEAGIVADIKAERIERLIEKFGYLPCEWCGKTMESHEVPIPDPHHNDWNRRHNFFENIRILARAPCHDYVQLHNIKDVPSML